MYVLLKYFCKQKLAIKFITYLRTGSLDQTYHIGRCFVSLLGLYSFYFCDWYFCSCISDLRISLVHRDYLFWFFPYICMSIINGIFMSITYCGIFSSFCVLLWDSIGYVSFFVCFIMAGNFRIKVLCLYLIKDFIWYTVSITRSYIWYMGFIEIMILFGFLNFCRCILVDESDNVVGHDTKYNCKRNYVSCVVLHDEQPEKCWQLNEEDWKR